MYFMNDNYNPITIHSAIYLVVDFDLCIIYDVNFIQDHVEPIIKVRNWDTLQDLNLSLAKIKP